MSERLTLESVFSKDNIDKAIALVAGNNALPGLDDLKGSDLPEYWANNGKYVLSDLASGIYRPVPYRVFYAKKPGKTERRRISVESALDQMLQQCMRFEADRFFTPGFHQNSYGFIRGRNTEMALRRCLKMMNGGMRYVVDADIRKCFDSIKHQLVLHSFSQGTSDVRLISLLSKILKTPGQCGTQILYNRIGVPQGSCLSPLLANIVLNRLDWFLADNKIQFVRYADDLVLFLPSLSRALRAKIRLEQFLSSVLSLQLNEEKTRIVPAEELEYLGFAFRRVGGQYHPIVSEKAKAKMHSKLEHHIRGICKAPADTMNRIGSVNRGWLEYYKNTYPPDLTSFLEQTETMEIQQISSAVNTHKDVRRDLLSAMLQGSEFVLPSELYEDLIERGRIKIHSPTRPQGL